MKKNNVILALISVGYILFIIVYISFMQQHVIPVYKDLCSDIKVLINSIEKDVTDNIMITIFIIENIILISPAVYMTYLFIKGWVKNWPTKNKINEEK